MNLYVGVVSKSDIYFKSLKESDIAFVRVSSFMFFIRDW